MVSISFCKGSLPGSRSRRKIFAGWVLADFSPRSWSGHIRASLPMREVAALILAAGQGTRFDSGPLETKLVAKLRDKPLVRHVAEAALASSARPVLVITGHASERVAGALDGLELQWVHNPDYAAGLAGSLKAGIRALPQSIRGALVLLGDMPFISAAL